MGGPSSGAVTTGVCRRQAAPRLGLPWSGLSRWGDVVIQPEQVVGVVSLFDLGQPLQIVPIGGADELVGCDLLLAAEVQAGPAGDGNPSTSLMTSRTQATLSAVLAGSTQLPSTLNMNGAHSGQHAPRHSRHLAAPGADPGKSSEAPQAGRPLTR
jgi:hypothetical protein